MTTDHIDQIAGALLDAYARSQLVPTPTETTPRFDIDDAYAVLAAIADRRREGGWQAVGRKIGFTNRTIWELYGVDRPMWAHVWRETVTVAEQGRATVALGGLLQPRIEPEVVFKLAAPPVAGVPAIEVVEWMAPGFEIVHCPYADWRFTIADCTAAFGLHGALVVGDPVAIDDANRAAVAATLATFEVTLARGAETVARGVGANVLGSPALALDHLAEVVSGVAPLEAGEIITTGTITDARVIGPGETWSSDYGELGLRGLTVEFTP